MAQMIHSITNNRIPKRQFCCLRACGVRVTDQMFSSCTLKATETFSRLHFAWKVLKFAHIWKGVVYFKKEKKKNYTTPSKRVSYPKFSCQVRVARSDRRVWRGTNPFSYRVQDFIEVHETDGDGDDLEEDGCEGDEPQALQGS